MVNQRANGACLLDGFGEHMSRKGARTNGVYMLCENWDFNGFRHAGDVCKLWRHHDVDSCFFARFLSFLGEFDGFFACCFRVSFKVQDYDWRF
jgi:hypothetical protein